MSIQRSAAGLFVCERGHRARSSTGNADSSDRVCCVLMKQGGKRRKISSGKYNMKEMMRKREASTRHHSRAFLPCTHEDRVQTTLL